MGWDGWGWAGTARTKLIPPKVSAVVQPAPVGSAPIFMSRKTQALPFPPVQAAEGMNAEIHNILFPSWDGSS